MKLDRRRGGTCDGRTVSYYTRLSGWWRVPHTRKFKKISRPLQPVCG